MTATLLTRIARVISERPLVIEPRTLHGILNTLGSRLGMEVEGVAEIAKPRRASLVRGDVVPVGNVGDYVVTPDGVAVVSICGVLVHRFDWLSSLCGLTSYEAIGAILDAVVVDARVRAIALDIDSPGGEISAVADVAAKIRDITAIKPVWAIANGFAASAAYWLASAADRVIVPRNSLVGSIGAVWIHCDQSARDEEMGLAYTAVFSGARKIDGWAHAPLSDTARTEIQVEVDRVRDGFAADVARYRGLNIDDVLSTEAAMYSEARAIDLRLADEIMSFERSLWALGNIARSGSDAVDTARFSGGAVMANQHESGDQQAPVTTSPPVSAVVDDPAAITERAAQITERCASAGYPELAADLIRENASDDRVAARLAQCDEIRDRVMAAASINPSAVSIEMVGEFIAKGLTPDQVSDELLSLIASSASNVSDIVSTQLAGAVDRIVTPGKGVTEIDTGMIWSRWNDKSKGRTGR